MTRERATREARRLRNIVQDQFGVQTVIDLKKGRPWSGNDWWSPHFIGHLGHHIVSRRSHGLTPFYNLVRNGRSDLPGPLSQFYIGFDGVFRIITLGLANHPGRGGPWSLPGGIVPENSGRAYLVGTEVEGGLDWSDWDADFRRLQARVFAGILTWMGRDERSHGEHGRPWAIGRKTDRIRYYQDLERARKEIARELGRDYGGLDMTGRYGDSGDAINVLQRNLRKLGFDPGAIDGVFGPKTRDALKAWAASRGKNWGGRAYHPSAYVEMQDALHEHREAEHEKRLDRHYQRLENQHRRTRELEVMHRDGGTHPVVLPGEVQATETPEGGES